MGNAAIWIEVGVGVTVGTGVAVGMAGLLSCAEAIAWAFRVAATATSICEDMGSEGCGAALFPQALNKMVSDKPITIKQVRF